MDDDRLTNRMGEGSLGPESEGCWRSPGHLGDRQGEGCTAGPSTDVTVPAKTHNVDDTAVSTDDDPEKRKKIDKIQAYAKLLKHIAVYVERIQLRTPKRKRMRATRKVIKEKTQEQEEGRKVSPARSQVSRDGEDEASESGHFVEVLEEDSPKRKFKRRGRKRPPTTGDYVGLAAAKKRLVEAERKERELEDDKVLLEMYPRLGSKILMNEEEKDRMERVKKGSSDEIAITLLEKMALVDKIARTSSNLKGTYVKTLRNIVKEVSVATAVLLERSKDEDKEEKRVMKREIAELKTQIEELKKEVRSPRRQEEMERRSWSIPREGLETEGRRVSSEEEDHPLIREKV
ncbi:hypothetical protein X777_06198 [Ooceraea biroi]|uniref:Uncharacterized protein n=1 Tax=Ooceraea biroi TaxID=2015173 RepID=A0A026X1C6_OOCBI|nr:hypothetical protein X777_06198 [Ooceraea biroi]